MLRLLKAHADNKALKILVIPPSAEKLLPSRVGLHGAPSVLSLEHVLSMEHVQPSTSHTIVITWLHG